MVPILSHGIFLISIIHPLGHESSGYSIFVILFRKYFCDLILFMKYFCDLILFLKYFCDASFAPLFPGNGCFSIYILLWCSYPVSDDRDKGNNDVNRPPGYMRWPHMKADQICGLSLREIGGGFTRHCRAPSIRAASYAIAKPSTMVQKMQNIKRLRGHRNSVYCGMASNLECLWKTIVVCYGSIINRPCIGKLNLCMKMLLV